MADFTERHSRKLGIFLTSLTGGAAIGICCISYPFLAPALRKICLPYVPATDQQIKNVLIALQGRKGSLLDIGSGDGRIVIAAAKNGFKTFGVELNPWLVWYARGKSYLSVKKDIRPVFYKKDLWSFPFNDFDNIVLFGVEEMMKEISLKFDREATNARIVVCRFPLPGKTPTQIIGSGIDTVWTYNF